MDRHDHALGLFGLAMALCILLVAADALRPAAPAKVAAALTLPRTGACSEAALEMPEASEMPEVIGW